jgi:hypothetical protein
MLIPGGKGTGNGWGFNREFYPHRRAFVKVFCPGAGDLPFDIIQHAISVRSLEPRIEKTGSPETFYFHIRFCLLAFWNLNTVHSLVSGDKI